MVPIEERTRVFWFFSRVRIIGWCCVWCEREAGPGEAERQWVASWEPPLAGSTNIRPLAPLRVPTGVPPRPRATAIAGAGEKRTR